MDRRLANFGPDWNTEGGMQLDSHKTYATLDASDIRFGIEHLPEQIRIAWAEECRNWIHGTPPQLAAQACGNRSLDEVQQLRPSDVAANSSRGREELVAHQP